MKYSMITMNVLVPVEDSERIKKSLMEWFYCHEVGMDWHSISEKDLDTSSLFLLHEGEV